MAIQAAPAPRQGMSRKTRESLTGWLFITPTLLIFGLFTFGAMIYAFFISFTDLGLFNEPKFVGFDTYGKVLGLPPGGISHIFDDSTGTAGFYKALGNTLIFSVIVVFFQTWLAIIFAVILNSKIRFRNFFRVTWYLPSVTASVVISLIFFWMYKQQGIVNAVITWISEHTVGALFGIHYQTIAFLDNSSTALPSIMAMNIFTTVPTFMVLFLAALQDIPTEVYEAAKLDGATTVRTFWSITLPLLRPIIFLVTVLGTIGTLQVFDQIYLMTNEGGPLGATTTVAYLIYHQAFKDNHLARSAAIGFILFIIIFLFFLVQRRFLDKDATA
jgi:multiple sugar transport system permease protein